MPGRRTLVTAAVLVGVAAAGAGALVLGSQAATQVGFGWFAYAPLSEEQLGSIVVVNGPRALGGGLVALGLVLVGLGAGLRVGPVARSGGARGVGALAALLLVAGTLALALPRRLVTTGGELPRSMDGTARGWSFPTILWSSGQWAGACAVLLGLLLLVGLAAATVGSTRRS